MVQETVMGLVSRIVAFSDVIRNAQDIWHSMVESYTPIHACL